MSVTTHFTPLLGALDEGPLCYLLEIDDCRLMLDCGWDDSFNIDQLSRLEEEIKKGFDAVIISHLDLAHIGALPYAVAKLGLNAPIYATAPVKKFGWLLFYDIHSSKTMEQDFKVFSMDDVDAAFELFQELRYDQPVSLPQYDIEMTPHCAGHLIGGAFWKIQKETDKIIYAVDYHHAKERHLEATKLTMYTRPTLLITDAFNAQGTVIKCRDRDVELLQSIAKTVRSSGDVLIPVDTAGRVLELLLVLDKEYSNYKLSANIVFLSHTSFSTQDSAKSNLEWMNAKLDIGDYELRHITTCGTLEQLEDIPHPRVVLATVPTLDCGYSRYLFAKMAEQPNNLIIFTSRQRSDCLAKQLLDNYANKSNQPSVIQFEQRERVPLEGDELEDYLKKLEDEKLVHEEHEPVPDLEMTQEEEPEEIIPLLPTSYFETSFDLVTATMNPIFRGSHPLFPFQEEQSDWDAYGEHVNWEAVKQNTGEDIQMNEEDDEEDDQIEKEEENTVPTKPVVKNIELNVQVRMKFIDFEGRSDGISMKNVLTLVEPSKVILIHGTKDSCDVLSTECKKTSGCRDTEFLIPSLGERIDASSGTVVFKLKLSESLINAQRYSTVSGCNVAYINGKIAYRPITQETNSSESKSPEEMDSNEEEQTTNGGDVEMEEQEQEPELEPYLVEIPENEVPGHDAVIMGAIPLGHLREALLKQDITVELNHGVLLCNNLIKIQKGSGGASRFQVDGPLCDDYFTIRNILYEQFSIL